MIVFIRKTQNSLLLNASVPSIYPAESFFRFWTGLVPCSWVLSPWVIKALSLFPENEKHMGTESWLFDAYQHTTELHMCVVNTSVWVRKIVNSNYL